MMMNRSSLPHIFLAVAALFLGTTALWGQTPQVDLSLDAALPQDPAVRVGLLDNGMTYYIRENSHPENRAELRLAVRAGSLQEDPGQEGLAHFVEHMAFNGTENFKSNELIDFLQSIGMRFGADLNAFTSFDQTVYFLQIPTEDEEILNRGLLILRDWAGGILFEDEDIDMERGVVIEEMRARRSGDQRIREVQMADIYAGTRWAERNPIGKKEVLQNAPYDLFRKFYRDWYRPDLMAIVAVGDFDADDVEETIREMFGALEMPEDPRTREHYPIEIHQGTRYSITFDPESRNPMVTVNYKHGRVDRATVGSYRESIVDGLVSGMLSERFQKIAREPNSPIIYGAAQAGLSLGGYRAFNVFGGVKDGRYLDALRVVLTEIERVRQHGFVASELERQKNASLVTIEQYYQERDKNESSSYAREYFSNFTTGESFPGIEIERMMYRTFIPELTLAEVNNHVRSLITEDGRGISIGGPETDETAGVTVEKAKDVVASVASAKVEPYTEEALEGDLFRGNPTPGSIVETRSWPEIGLTEWTLSNGITVVLKPTDFKNNEILMRAYSPGGTSLIPDEDYIPAATASTIVAQGGLGPYDRIQLGQYLSDKVVGSSASIGELWETINGQASNDDLERLFQLVHLQFTEPRKDPEALRLFREQVASALKTQGANPDQVFQDSMQYIASGYHPRSKPWTLETLDELDLDKSYAIYLDRFSNAGDFTFFFVGSFDTNTIRPLVQTYLASLPGTGHTETWRDIGERAPTGEVRKVIRKGIEAKATVRLMYHGTFDWSMESRHLLSSMTSVLDEKVRETLREEKGGVYSPGVWIQYEQFPISTYAVNVYFQCDPERVDELIADVERIIGEMRAGPVDQTYVSKVAEMQIRERETGLKENGRWAQSIMYYYQNNEPPTNIVTYGDLPGTLTPEIIHQAARKYLGGENRMTFILLPE